MTSPIDPLPIEDVDVRALGGGSAGGEGAVTLAAVELVVTRDIDDGSRRQADLLQPGDAMLDALAQIAGDDHHIVLRPRSRKLEGKRRVDVEMQVGHGPKAQETPPRGHALALWHRRAYQPNVAASPL